jgi:hypothetical protein
MRPLQPPRRGIRRTAFLLLAAVLMPDGRPSRAADPQPYEVKIAPTGDATLDAALSGSSVLVSLREKAPVGPFALIARAQQDADRFRTALNSFGFYDGKMQIRIAGRPLDDPTLADTLDATPATPPVPVAVSVETGTRFHLDSVKVEGTVPEQARDKLDLAPGAPAVASDVLAARTRLLDALREQGYAMAKVSEPVAILHEKQDALDVTYNVETGPRVDLGPIAINGLDAVNESFVRRRLLLHPGEQFSPSAIEKARQDLMSTGVFSAVRAVPAEQLDPAGELPLAFDTATPRAPSNSICRPTSATTPAGVPPCAAIASSRSGRISRSATTRRAAPRSSPAPSSSVSACSAVSARRVHGRRPGRGERAAGYRHVAGRRRRGGALLHLDRPDPRGHRGATEPPTGLGFVGVLHRDRRGLLSAPAAQDSRHGPRRCDRTSDHAVAAMRAVPAAARHQVPCLRDGRWFGPSRQTWRDGRGRLARWLTDSSRCARRVV